MTTKPKLLAILTSILVLTSLACGGNATPEKVGEVEKPAAQQEAKAQQPAVTEAEQSEEVEIEPVSNQSESQEPAQQPQPQVFNVGDIVTIGDSTLVVLGWDNVEPSEFFEPDPGKKFIAVDLLVVNNSSEARGISSLMQMSLKDSTAQQYKPDLMANMAVDSNSVDGELAPGEKLRGRVGFSVPESISGLQFVFDANIFGTGKVTVNLGDQPLAVDPPSEIAGEAPQQIFAVGDVVEIGDFSLVVNEVTEPQATDFFQPDEGKRFLGIDLTLENKTTEPVAVSTMLQMEVKDDTGQTYNLDIGAISAMDGTTPDGELAPGEKLRGQVGYQVPRDATGLMFVFDASVFGKGKLFVALP